MLKRAGCSYSMPTCTSLCNDFLAYSLGYGTWPRGIIDFMGPGMVEAFCFRWMKHRQHRLSDFKAKIERIFLPYILLQQLVQLSLKGCLLLSRWFYPVPNLLSSAFREQSDCHHLAKILSLIGLDYMPYFTLSINSVIFSKSFWPSVWPCLRHHRGGARWIASEHCLHADHQR